MNTGVRRFRSGGTTSEAEAVLTQMRKLHVSTTRTIRELTAQKNSEPDERRKSILKRRIDMTQGMVNQLKVAEDTLRERMGMTPVQQAGAGKKRSKKTKQLKPKTKK